MKKFYMLVAASLVAATSFGQRNIDLELTLSTPTPDSTVPQSTAQELGFTVTNLEDDLVANDTIFIWVENVSTGMVYTLAGQAGYVNQLPLTAAYAALFNAGPISSTAFNQGNTLTFNTAASGFNVGDTLAVVVDFSAAPGNPGTEAVFSNNYSLFKLGAAQVSVESVDALSLVAFPNPATSELNVIAKEEIVSISITNLEGKVVATSSSSKVNVSELTSGIYIYEVTTVSGLKAVKKFAKN